MTLAISCADSPNNIEWWLGAVSGYASINSTSGDSSFNRARKRRANVWLAGNLRVEVVAYGLFTENPRVMVLGEWASGTAASRKPPEGIKRAGAVRDPG
jgi:hypothetical protein